MTPTTNGTHQTLTRVPAEEQRVLKLPTDRFRFCPTNPPGRLEDVTDLLASIGQLGQQVPGISYPDPERPECYIVADGNRRLMTLRILGLMFLTIILDHEPSKKELRRIRLALNNAHKHMTPDQVADEVAAHIAETGDSQTATAEFFGLSPGYVSKLLAPSKRLIPELAHMAANPAITREVLRIISSMPTPELQKKLADRVLADMAGEGRRLSRDAIQAYAEELRGVRKAKDKPLAIKHDGITLGAKKTTPDALKAFGEKLLAAVKKLKPGDGLGDLPFLFRTA